MTHTSTLARLMIAEQVLHQPTMRPICAALRKNATAMPMTVVIDRTLLCRSILRAIANMTGPKDERSRIGGNQRCAFWARIAQISTRCMFRLG